MPHVKHAVCVCVFIHTRMYPRSPRHAAYCINKTPPSRNPAPSSEVTTLFFHLGSEQCMTVTSTTTVSAVHSHGKKKKREKNRKANEQEKLSPKQMWSDEINGSRFFFPCIYSVVLSNTHNLLITQGSHTRSCCAIQKRSMTVKCLRCKAHSYRRTHI